MSQPKCEELEDIANVRDLPKTKAYRQICVFERYENVSVNQRLLMHEKEDFGKRRGTGTEPVH